MTQPTATVRLRKPRPTELPPDSRPFLDPPPDAPLRPSQGSWINQHGAKPGEITRITGVLFGPPKSGKTTVAASGSKTLLIEFDPDGDKVETLAGRTDITVLKPANWMEMDSIIKDLGGIERDNFRWVVVDSVTFWTLNYGGKGLAEAAKNNKDPRKEYLRLGSSINQNIQDMLTLPQNILFTAHLKLEDDEDEDGVALNPEEGQHPVSLAVTPMVFQVLNAAVSFIGRTYKKPGPKGTTDYFVSFEDHGRSPAGSRVPLPKNPKNLNMDEALAYAMKGSK